jgi:hypothetical protein
MFRGSVKGTGFPLHSPVSPSLPLPRVTVCHHISAGLYQLGSHWTNFLEMFIIICLENLHTLPSDDIMDAVAEGVLW